MTFKDARRALTTLYVAFELHVTRLRYAYAGGVLGAGVIVFLLWTTLLSPPALFPEGHIITIAEGAPISEVATALEEAGVIRSPLLYSAFMRITGASPDAGKYVFQKPVGLFQVMYRTATGGYGIEATRVVFVEGATVREMARILKEDFPDFDADGFVNKALPLEGYLYPDTYFLYPDLTPDDVIIELFRNFTVETASLEPQIRASAHSEKDLLIMASILEKEGRDLAEKRAIAGVLWHRIDLGMPLQVDAVFSYIRDVPLFSPKFSDLEIDSPYNTYLYKGLPPGPIGNPSANSILAAATPIETTALFYLTGNDGVTRFAKTFEEHKRNRANYLD